MTQLQKFWEKLKLIHKFSIVLMSLLSLLLLILGGVVYQTRKTNQISLTEERMHSQVHDLYIMVAMQHELKQQQGQTFSNRVLQMIRDADPEESDSLVQSLRYNLSGSENMHAFTPADISFLESKLTDIRYFSNGFPAIFDAHGIMLMHPEEKGKDISQTALFEKIKMQSQGTVYYHWPEDGDSKQYLGIYYKYFQPWDIYVAALIDADEVLKKPLASIRFLIFSSIIIGIIILSVLLRLLLRLISKPIEETTQVVEKLSKGIQQQKIEYTRQDEIADVFHHINNLISGLKNTADFAIEIGRKNFDHPFTPLSKEDALGNALITMRESLKKAEEEEKLRKIEDEKRRWTNEGLAKFGEILRQNNDNMALLSTNIISNLVKYLDINQGGLFIVNQQNDGEKFLEMTGCYAYDREKFMKKRIEIGEGITGTCYLEKQTIYLRNVPENYMQITSGLGDASPGYLLVVPLRLNEEVHGVIELASFNDFQKHEIDFIEKIGESIASTISGVKISAQTTELLEQSQQQSEEMRAQEEEMRQNMEEMQATHEELNKRNEEMKRVQETLKEERALLIALLESSEDYIYFKDKNSKFLRVSKSLLKLLNLKGQHEVVGRSDFDFADEEIARPKYDAEQEIIRTGKVLKIEEKDIGQDGSERWVSTVKMPLRDETGIIIGTFGVSRDITEVKQALIKAMQNEHELVEKVDQIQSLRDEMALQQKTILKILNQIPQKVYLKDKDLKFVFVNQAVANVYENKSVEDLIGTSDFDHYADDLATQYSNSDYEVLEKGEQIFEQEDIVRGVSTILKTHKQPFFIDHLNQTGLLGIQTDVTELVKYRVLEKENTRLKSEIKKLKG
jgi:PAS domain S-box-containing protein